ncbi:SAF domain-containing protein [Nocardia puris]|uniref:Flp pilus assembly protein CpaB n=1 Tax=Nocardia puris TaxID=208602 RepID=A0A366DS45_9NOCA|nr:SAF domain-containing protein [Nocardia puris]RBO92916.1 Flp pilus assembly protein CpaB [Nocardia puris]
MTRALADLGRADTLRSVLHNRPSWADGVLLRRLLAAALAVLALILVVRGDPEAARTEVVVAERELAPGRLLEPGDLRTVPRESGTLPEGATTSTADLVGSTLTGGMRAGEIFTDLRVVGPRLAHVATGGADARIVPIRLADTAVAEILRAGDRVDVIGGGEQGTGARPARALAVDAAVVLVAAPGERSGGGERVVLVAMDAAHAAMVAAASLHTALTVVFH